MVKILFIKITTISHKPLLKNYMVSSKEGVFMPAHMLQNC